MKPRYMKQWAISILMWLGLTLSPPSRSNGSGQNKVAVPHLLMS